MKGHLVLASLSLLVAGTTRSPATPPPIDQPGAVDPGVAFSLPRLRVADTPHAAARSALAWQMAPLPAPKPLDSPRNKPLPAPLKKQDHADLPPDAADLRAALVSEVAGIQSPSSRVVADAAARATALIHIAHLPIEQTQLVLVVDRNPARQRLYLMLARPGGAAGWHALGAAHISTGQAGRKDHYITPIGVFAHTDAILDYRAQGTFNENHVRGLGVAGMRVWDFGWQWALKGWHSDGEGGDIRLEMHATDPDLLERRLGHPASEGCIRLSAALNRFLDTHGVLDADYERAAVQDVRYRAVLSPDRTANRFAGRLLVVIDTSLPMDTPPTSASRPSGWPSPEPGEKPGDQARPGAPGTDSASDAPIR